MSTCNEYNILYPGTIVRVMSTVPGTGGTVLMSSATVMMSLRSTTVYGKYCIIHKFILYSSYRFFIERVCDEEFVAVVLTNI